MSAKTDTAMAKSLSLWNFFTIGFGAIIGTGWILLVGDWMTEGGGPIPAMIAFAIGALFLLPVGAVFGELTAAIPVSGGSVEYVDRAFGRTASFITAWFLALGNAIIVPWESIAIANLAGELMPFLKTIKLYEVMGAPIYLPTLVLGCAGAAYVIYLNVKGAASAAKLQGFLTKVLLGGMGVTILLSFIKGSPANLTPVFTPTGNANSLWLGVLPVLVMTPFFYAGFDTIPQQAEEAAEGLDWRKFGVIISMALLAAGGFYLLAIYGFGSFIPWQQFVTYNIPALTVLGVVGLGIFGKIMMAVAMISPLGPMNSFFGASTRIMLAMGRKGQLPPSFAKLHPQYKTPTAANLLMAVLALAGPFLGPNMLVPLTNISSLGFIIGCLMVSCACLKLRATEPDLNRPYTVPGGKVGIWAAIIACAVIVGLMVVPFSPAALSAQEWAIVAVWLVLGVIFMLTRRAGRRSEGQPKAQAAD